MHLTKIMLLTAAFSTLSGCATRNYVDESLEVFRHAILRIYSGWTI
jgi:hypothetical protein